MKKITLLTHETDVTSFSADWLLPIYEEFFNIELYDKKKTYDNKFSIVLHSISGDKSWASHLEGHKILYDHLFEFDPNHVNNSENEKHLVCQSWGWYHECLWYLHLGYDQYNPQRNYAKKALMLMRRQSSHRDILLDKLNSFLDDFVYSYIDKEIFLTGDIIENGDVFQRHFNPDWYNSTCFSMVAESNVRTDVVDISEKTFKCFAHQHPFMIFGCPGTLDHVKNLGFATYDNMFDETYDNIIDYNQRLDIIYTNIINFEKRQYDLITLEKIIHNKNLFFNKDLVRQKIINEVVEPILEYAET